jgi:N-acetylglucosaminyl-diphospho-decaprenol L-rhamnosyltransferase
MTTLSIIILTYNPGTILLDCLRSLPAGVNDLTYEVIVVDNASTDGLVQQAQAAFPHHRYILNPDNRGFAGGNNQGLAQATGDYLLLLNPDVIVEPGSLKAMVAFLEQHPKVGMVGPLTRDARGQIALTARPRFTVAVILWQYLGLDRLFPYRVFGHYRAASRPDTPPFPVNWVQGSCLLTRRTVYERIGGLDEGFFLFYEEPDWCGRAADAGWETWFVPSAAIYHHESTSVSRYPLRRIRAYHLSPLHFFHKRGQRGAVRWLKLGFTLELGFKGGVRLVQRLIGRQSVSPAIYRQVLREIWRYPDRTS